MAEQGEMYDDILAARIQANGGKISAKLVLCHSDEVSGTTHFDDGSIIFWGEKSCVGQSPIIAVKQWNGILAEEGGETVLMGIDELESEGYGFALEYFENGPSPECEMRMMTEEEEEQWNTKFHEPTDR